MNEKNFIPKTTLIGLSGGIDSAVAAKLLLTAGFNVIGIHLRLWHEKKDTLKKREKLTKKVAQKIGIPLLIIDAEKNFTKYVVNDFWKELKTGRTPNPCVECNYYVKFQLLNNLAKKLKADYLATGHYARIKKEFKKGRPIYKLLRAADRNKDQSYFLWRLNQQLLQKIIFPLSIFSKDEVREMARRWRLNFKPAESQNICFSNNLKELIIKKIKPPKGNIIDALSGKVLGQHLGLPLYTIGQRKNIRLPAKEPYYVIKKDLKKNTLIIVPASAKKILKQNVVRLSKIHFIGPKPKLPLNCKAKLRYRSKAITAQVCHHQFYYLKFKKPVFAPTPGQSAVFYLKNEVIGGGVIKK